MREKEKTSRRILQLEGMRFIMCCIIMMSHFEFLKESNLVGEIYEKFFHNATMAVDYFFMLSGFGICLSKKRFDRTLKGRLNFAINKVKKIYPIYIISLIIAIPISVCILLDYDVFFKALLKIIFLFGIDLSLLQSLFGMTYFSHAINGVCWFMSCIFICYFIMTWMIDWIDKLDNVNKIWISLILSVFLIIILSIFFTKVESLNLFGGKVDDLWYGHPFIRCWYLFIGAIIGVLYKEINIKFKNRNEIEIIGICLLYFLFRNSLLELCNRNWLRLIDLILCFSLIWIISKGQGIVVRKLSNEQMVQLGKLSMYIYLFHYPIRVTIGKIFKKYLIIEKTGEVGYFIECILIIGCTVCLVLVCKYIYEKKGNR